MKPETLTSLASLLNKGGCNYTVFLKSYSVPLHGDPSSEQVVRVALGNSAVVGGIHAVTTAKMQAEVNSCISYAGDGGAGPDSDGIHSVRFKELLATLLSEVEAASRKASRVEQFWLKEGHPAYPVFWDFAFLIIGSNEATILVGSSSD